MLMSWLPTLAHNLMFMLMHILHSLCDGLGFKKVHFSLATVFYAALKGLYVAFLSKSGLARGPHAT